MVHDATVESLGPTPGRSRRIFIVTSVVLLVLAGAYVFMSRTWPAPPECPEAPPRPSQCDWIMPGVPRASTYQVLYALISLEVVLFLYLRGVEQWSPESAVSSVEKVQRGKIAARMAGGPVVSHPLGPRLEPPPQPAPVPPDTRSAAVPPDTRSAAF